MQAIYRDEVNQVTNLIVIQEQFMRGMFISPYQGPMDRKPNSKLEVEGLELVSDDEGFTD